MEATEGELAEKLFAALKAGDEAGGDRRGKQTASMLILRKGGGRNINNDRYLYLNVDDNPQPLPELRRLSPSLPEPQRHWPRACTTSAKRPRLWPISARR